MLKSFSLKALKNQAKNPIVIKVVVTFCRCTLEEFPKTKGPVKGRVLQAIGKGAMKTDKHLL